MQLVVERAWMVAEGYACGDPLGDLDLYRHPLFIQCWLATAGPLLLPCVRVAHPDAQACITLSCRAATTRAR